MISDVSWNCGIHLRHSLIASFSFFLFVGSFNSPIELLTTQVCTLQEQVSNLRNLSEKKRQDVSTIVCGKFVECERKAGHKVGFEGFWQVVSVLIMQDLYRFMTCYHHTIPWLNSVNWILSFLSVKLLLHLRVSILLQLFYDAAILSLCKNHRELITVS